jgi:hypothetical protein
MKRLVVIPLLLVVLVQGTIDLWTVVIFHVQREYISQNLCVNRFDAIPVCNGQCYLDKQLQENEEKQDQALDTRQSEVHLFCQKTEIGESIALLVTAPIRIGLRSVGPLASAFTWSIDHPPEVA